MLVKGPGGRKINFKRCDYATALVYFYHLSAEGASE